jgi:hypothetical protein
MLLHHKLIQLCLYPVYLKSEAYECNCFFFTKVDIRQAHSKQPQLAWEAVVVVQTHHILED